MQRTRNPPNRCRVGAGVRIPVSPSMKSQRQTLFRSLQIFFATIFSLLCGSIAGTAILSVVFSIFKAAFGAGRVSYNSLTNNRVYLSWLAIISEAAAIFFIWLFNHFVFKIKIKFIDKNFLKALIIGFPTLIFIVINFLVLFAKAIHLSFLNDFTAIVLSLLIGIFEEYSARGIMIGNLDTVDNQSKFPNYSIIIISAIFFSGLHLLNLLSAASLAVTGIQMIYTMSLGVLFGLIYLTTKNLTATILFHSVIDMIAFLADPNAIFGLGNSKVNLLDFSINALILIAACIYAAWILRMVKKHQLNFS